MVLTVVDLCEKTHKTQLTKQVKSKNCSRQDAYFKTADLCLDAVHQLAWNFERPQ